MKTYTRSIHDGAEKIVHIAPEFVKDGDRLIPLGFYEITISRNTVLVHNCIISEPEELRDFQAAMTFAYEKMNLLRNEPSTIQEEPCHSTR